MFGGGTVWTSTFSDCIVRMVASSDPYERKVIWCREAKRRTNAHVLIFLPEFAGRGKSSSITRTRSVIGKAGAVEFDAIPCWETCESSIPCLFGSRRPTRQISILCQSLGHGAKSE